MRSPVRKMPHGVERIFFAAVVCELLRDSFLQEGFLRGYAAYFIRLIR